jgi:hypothetical protein
VIHEPVAAPAVASLGVVRVPARRRAERADEGEMFVWLPAGTLGAPSVEALLHELVRVVGGLDLLASDSDRPAGRIPCLTLIWP